MSFCIPDYSESVGNVKICIDGERERERGGTRQERNNMQAEYTRVGLIDG